MRAKGGGGGKARRGVGSAQREGHLTVSDGQKGGRAWKIPGMVGGEGGRSAHVIRREDNGLVSLQVVSSICGGNQASSDLLFVLCSVCNHGFIQLLLFILVYGATK